MTDQGQEIVVYLRTPRKPAFRVNRYDNSQMVEGYITSKVNFTDNFDYYWGKIKMGFPVYLTIRSKGNIVQVLTRYKTTT